MTTLKSEIEICKPVDVEFRDAGPWRSYEVYTYGKSLIELFDNAQINEIDQDGGELRDYPLVDATAAVIREAQELIFREFRMASSVAG